MDIIIFLTLECVAYLLDFLCEVHFFSPPVGRAPRTDSLGSGPKSFPSRQNFNMYLYPATKTNSPHLQHNIAAKVHLRRMPRLKFSADTGFDTAEHMASLFAKLT